MVKSSGGNRRNAIVNLAAFVVVIAGMKAASSLIVPFLLALFLTIISLPLMLFLKRIKVPDVIAFLLILMLVIGLWMLLVVILGSTLQEFTRSMPAYQDRMKQLISDGYTWLLAHDIAVDRSMVDSIFDPGKIMQLVSSVMNSLVAILKNVFFILLMFAFLIIEASGIPDKIKTIRHNRADSLSSYDAIIGMVNRYLGIKFITSFITGAMIYMGLLYIGLDFSILWAVLSFILNFVPTIGSLIASIPAILLALVQLGPVYAFGTALLFLFVNTVVGTIAEPRIMGERVGLSSIVVLLSLIFWGWVLGPMGMLLSVPLTMTVKIALSENESTQWISILLAPNSELSRFKRLGKK
ncbi:AI-2E family transporter [Desulfobacter curvatus]|uniref:AI-2E family transporter n=1 Tax=Desulfobacter curvatus TaxID=2290 RepID=UPI000377E492|nr:AI-2E family transporter [Desulfobacter curvatus]